MKRISTLGLDIFSVYEKILRIVSVTYRIISLVELAALLDRSSEAGFQETQEVVEAAGVSLSIQSGSATVRFIHQSAKGFFFGEHRDSDLR